MDLGSETAKHCMVSYFCCWGSCSCASSWLSLWGLTSIRQLNVWLFLLGPSLDHGTPFTTGRQEGEEGDLQCGFLWILFDEFYCSQKLNNKTGRAATSEPREATSLRVKDIMRATQREWSRKKCKKGESSCWVEISHNEQLEPVALCHLSTAMHHSQPSICMSSKTSLPIFLLLSNTYTGVSKHACTCMCAHTHTQRKEETCTVTHTQLI